MSLAPASHTPRYFVDGAYTLLLFYDGSGNVEYECKAVPGTASDAIGWQICKFTYSSGSLISVTWASGSDEFRFVADDRASYTYS